jgi:hypothetical protein
VKSRAKHEISSSKNRVLMHEGQRKCKCRVLKERRRLFVNVMILAENGGQWKIVRRNESYFHNNLVQCLWVEYIKLVFLRFLHVRLKDWTETLRTDSEKGLYLDNTAV